jgi:hypothetical protein
MTRLKRNIYDIVSWFVYLATLTGVCHATAPSVEAPAADQRPSFVKLNRAGQPMATASDPALPWHCVLDRRTKLIWEVKTRDNRLQDATQTYSWLWPDPQKNGGHSGYPDKGRCSLKRCNTQDYINAINDTRLCGSSEWRLPTREELRTLVDYTVAYPGPTIDQAFFPHTQGQFYWSSNTDANNIDSAWGIGFSFGFDYAYFKSDMGHVRLVSGPVR